MWICFSYKSQIAATHEVRTSFKIIQVNPLTNHFSSHTGNRNFSCSICHKRFLYSYNVSAHIKHVHWKEKRKPDAKNKCSICAKKFVHKSTLMEHLQNDHNVVLITEDETITVEEMDETGLEDSFET